MGSWRFYSVTPEVSGPLSFWGFGVVVGCFFFSSLAVLIPGACWWMAACTVGSAVLALRGGRRWPFWWLFGFSLAGMVVAARGRELGEGRWPVRFACTVRDGWQLSETGWRTRVRVRALEGAPRSFRELTLTVGGSANPVTLPPPGSRVEGAGELVKRREAVVLWVKSPLLLRAGPPGGIDHFRERTREKLVEAAGFNPGLQRAASLAAALVLGRREALLEGEVASLREAGLAHLLAVSGLHVGLVLGVFWLVLTLLGVRPNPRRWALVPVAFLFCLISGGATSVRRATLASVFLLAGRSLGRPLELLPCFWGVVGVLSLGQPQVVWEPGLQLSAGVALALVRWVGPVQRRLGRGKLAAAAAVALVAQLASSPLLGLHFAYVPALAMPLNVLAVPLAAALVALALVACLLAWIWPLLAHWALGMLAILAPALQALASLGETAALPFPLWPTLLVVVFAWFFLLAWLPWPGAGVAFGAVAVLTVGSVLWPHLPRPSQTRVVMLPVSQGMALWLAGERGSLLVDTGRAGRQVSWYLARFKGSGRLSALVLTHPDADHVGGARLALSLLRPDALYLPEIFRNRSELLPLRWQAQKRGVPVVGVRAGQRLRAEDIVCDVLWPEDAQGLEDNEASLVLRCQLGGVSLLVVGDLTKSGEAALLASGQAVAASILQVGHHGSRTSSSMPFLSAVSPRLALVPTGTAPRFAFPHGEVVERLRRTGALVLVQREGFGEVQIHQGGLLEVEGSSVLLRVGR